ncbi:unnamed protein product [Rhodiola kirilowii]
MPDTRATTAAANIQDLSAVVLQHTEQFSSIHDALTGINQKLHELSVANARAEKQPLLPTPPTPPASPNPSPTQSLDYHHSGARTPRLEIPLFTGENVTGWIFQIERFFQHHFTPRDQRLLIATFYMSGPALLWYQWMHNTKQISDWESFRRDLELRFGPSSFINHEAALYKLRQHSSLSTYVAEFESMSTCTPGLTTSNLLNCFMSGLREDIKRELFVHRPVTLPEAVGLAKLIESRLEAPRFNLRPAPHRSLATSNTTPSTSPNRLPIRRLTAAEMTERRERGLCYNCDERWVSGHRCKPKFLCLLVDSPSEDLLDDPYDSTTLLDDDPCPTQSHIIHPDPTLQPTDAPNISLHALEGHFVPSTLRLAAKIDGRQIMVLIDGGSTHNFMQTRLAKSLRLAVEPSPHLSVTVGNGEKLNCAGFCKQVPLTLNTHQFSVDLHLIHLHGADIVLGVQWLASLGQVVFDYKELWLSFEHMGAHIKLHGIRQASLTHLTLGQFSQVLHSDGAASLFLLSITATEPESHLTQADLGSSELPNIDIVSQLAPTCASPLQQLLLGFAKVFEPTQGLPPQRHADHNITLWPGTPPINVRPYRYPYHQKTIIENLIAEMLTEGIIRPSTSPFSSPVLLVKKKDGSWRFCIDYRALNAVTIPDRFPIPTVEELLDELHGATVFSKFDLRSGYHQVRVQPSDTHKTTFRTHDGHYEFLVMPFGLTNAPATFQSIMNSVFRPFLRKFVLVFFDDILVYSCSWQDHLKHLHQVLSILQLHKLFAKPSKCDVGRHELVFLGHIISAKGVAVDPSKIDAIQQWPRPTSTKQLRSFLGLAGYYRKFVKSYAQVASPLTKLLVKDAFCWNDSAEDAFVALKTALTTTPVLALPDFTKPFAIETDASGVGIGAILTQNNHPLAYFSKLLSPKLQRSSAYNRELYAVVQAVLKWRTYLLGRRFTIISDHQPLRSLLTQTIHTPDQQHWLAKLLGFDFEVIYRPGKQNEPADALSRMTCNTMQGVTRPVLGILRALRQFYQSNPTAAKLFTDILAQPTSHPKFSVRDGLILYNNKLWVPEESALRDLILHEFHDGVVGGHAGIHRTLARVSANFAWPKMRASVCEYVNHCTTCQQAKPLNSASPGLLQPLPIPQTIWSDISMDFITHLPPSHGRTVIMVVVDRLSKYAHFIPLRHGFTASSVAQAFIKEIVRLHGFPTSIVSDRDPIFMSHFWQDLFRLQGTILSASSSYHPQSDGQTEVVNRCLEDYLRCFVADTPSRWLDFIPWAEWCYNTAFHSATKTSPYEVVYGHPPPTILDYMIGSTSSAAVEDLLTTRTHVIRALRTSLERAQLRMKHQADAHRVDKSYDVGDWAFVKLQPYRQLSVAQRTSNKLSKRYFGPFQILARIGPVAYRLDLPPSSKIHNVFHVSLLKPCKGDPTAAPVALPPSSIASHPTMRPMKLLGFRIICKGSVRIPQVLVQWENLSPTEATWVNAATFVKGNPSSDLADKVILDGGGNVTGILHGPIEDQQSASPQPRRTTRALTRPKKLKDFVT